MAFRNQVKAGYKDFPVNLFYEWAMKSLHLSQIVLAWLVRAKNILFKKNVFFCHYKKNNNNNILLKHQNLSLFIIFSLSLFLLCKNVWQKFVAKYPWQKCAAEAARSKYSSSWRSGGNRELSSICRESCFNGSQPGVYFDSLCGHRDLREDKKTCYGTFFLPPNM